MAVQQEAVIEKMLAPAMSALAEVSAVVPGAGEEARTVFKEIDSTAKGMLSAGQSAAAALRASRTDEKVKFEDEPGRALRMQKEQNLTGAADKLIRNGNDSMLKAVARFESVLETTSLPGPAKDPASRMLLRDEVRVRYGRMDPDRLHQTLTQRIGEHPGHDSEILADFGKDWLMERGLSEDQVAGLRQHAVTKYLTRTDGSRTQLAARATLSAYRSSNLKGKLTGFREAGRMHLGNANGS